MPDDIKCTVVYKTIDVTRDVLYQQIGPDWYAFIEDEDGDILYALVPKGVTKVELVEEK